MEDPLTMLEIYLSRLFNALAPDFYYRNEISAEKTQKVHFTKVR